MSASPERDRAPTLMAGEKLSQHKPRPRREGLDASALFEKVQSRFPKIMKRLGE